MSSKKRTAFTAALYFCVALLGAVTTPGLAFETERPSVEAVNHASAEMVPAAALAPTASAAITSLPRTTIFAPSAPIVQPLPAVAPASSITTFGSLAAAVAAQPAEVGEDEEIHCLATGIYFESKGEPLPGQLAVAEVILNRADSGRFASSSCGVLKQKGQFSFVRGGKLPEVNRASSAWRTAVAIAHVAKRDLWDSPVEGALYFHARRLSPRWGRARVASLGNHVFYR